MKKRKKTDTSGTAARWIHSIGIVGWVGGLVILLIVLTLLWIVIGVVTPTAINGLSAPAPNDAAMSDTTPTPHK